MASLNIDVKQALAEIRALITELEKLKAETKAVNKANAATYDKLSDSLTKLRRRLSEVANKMNYMEAIMKKNKASTAQDSREIKLNTIALNKNTIALNAQARAKRQSAQASKEAAKQTSSLTSFFSGLASRATILIGSFIALKAILRQTYKSLKDFDSLNYTLKQLTDSTFEYNEAQSFLLRLSKDFGVELKTTTERYIKFMAAADQSGLSLKDTEKIFRSMTKASAVLGLQTDELRGVYLALEQMLSKGKITTEELRRQLGERLPGAMGIMAASMGVTIPQLDKMMKKGEVLSAEVLPDFADAVELAYGIETINKVENLVAAQGRLTSAWQNFVRNVTEGEGIIKKSIGAILNNATKLIQAFSWITATPEQLQREAIAQRESLMEESLKNYYLSQAEKETEGAKTIQQLRDENAQLARQKDRANNAEERQILQDKIDQNIKLITEYVKRADELFDQAAEGGISELSVRLETARQQYRDLKAQISNVQISDDGDDWNTVTNDEFQELIKTMEKAGQTYEDLQAQFNIYKRRTTTSNVATFEDEDEDGVKKREANLRTILDLDRVYQAKVLESQIAANKRLIASDEINNVEKQRLMNENNKLLLQANKLYHEQKLYELEVRYNDEVAKLEEQYAEGLVNEEKYLKQLDDLNREYGQKKEIAGNEFSDKNVASIEANRAELLANYKHQNEEEIKLVEEKYNKEIIAAKEAYRVSEQTTKDKETLERRLAIIHVEATKAKIDKEIEFYRWLQANIELSAEASAQLEALITKLEASKLVLDPEKEESVDEWKEMFQEIAGLARDFNAAIGDLVQATFDRKIEYINAEIEAEKEKYDKLIELAKGDEAQQDQLRKEKDAKIKKLEKKRLKEEQKAARARKAFAISDIIINTASAIVEALPNIPLSIAIGALGAIQLATVIATPIPQYKKGLDRAKEDHIGMINDGGKIEYIERGKDILTTSTRNAVVQLKKGDIVHKDYDTMTRKSKVFSKAFYGAEMKEGEFNRLCRTVEVGIEKGFKKANINNKINVINRGSNDRYRDSQSRWN